MSKNKKEWSEKLLEALREYRITIRGATQAAPFSLVYGSKAVLPLEVQILSLRVAIQGEFPTQQNAELQLQELESLDERRLIAKQNIELNQTRSAVAIDRLGKYWSFKKGDIVLTIRRRMQMTNKFRGKFQPKWEGPYVDDTMHSNGAYHLSYLEGNHY